MKTLQSNLDATDINNFTKNTKAMITKIVQNVDFVQSPLLSNQKCSLSDEINIKWYQMKHVQAAKKFALCC